MKSPSVFASVRFALAGVRRALAAERNFRVHAAVALVAGLTGWWLGLAPVEWAVLGLTVGFVLCAELANTALELVVDVASPEWHPQAGAAKDVAAAVVLVAAATAVAVGLALFGPKLLALVSRPGG